jgi:hypothetical protein
MAKQRTSLASFAPMTGKPDGAKILASATPGPVSASRAYPKVSVYLTAEEVRTLKLLSIDMGQRVSDIGAMAVREWLERNGHSRSIAHKA